MKKQSYKETKQFPPLDDLFVLLEMMEKTIGITISDDDYIIGRQQLFSTFLHETGHAFINKKAKWIHGLDEDEYDFIDEVVVRILIDTLIDKINLSSKINPYFSQYRDHKNELKNYGYNFKSEEYVGLTQIWKSKYEVSYDLDGFCKEVYNYYKLNKSIIDNKNKTLLQNKR